MDGNLFAKNSCMFSIVNINILFVFPYREYNSSFMKSTLLRNVCVYCITGKVYVLFWKKKNAKLMEFATK